MVTWPLLMNAGCSRKYPSCDDVKELLFPFQNVKQFIDVYENFFFQEKKFPAVVSRLWREALEMGCPLSERNVKKVFLFYKRTISMLNIKPSVRIQQQKCWRWLRMYPVITLSSNGTFMSTKQWKKCQSCHFYFSVLLHLCFFFF